MANGPREPREEGLEEAVHLATGGVLETLRRLEDMPSASAFVGRRAVLGLLGGGAVLGGLGWIGLRGSSSAHAAPGNGPEGNAPISSPISPGKPPVAFKAETTPSPAAPVSSPTGVVASADAKSATVEVKEKPKGFRKTDKNGLQWDAWVREERVNKKEIRVHAKVISRTLDAKGRVCEEFPEKTFEFEIPQKLVKLFGGTPLKNAMVAVNIYDDPSMYEILPKKLKRELEGDDKSIAKGFTTFEEIKE